MTICAYLYIYIYYCNIYKTAQLSCNHVARHKPKQQSCKPSAQAFWSPSRVAPGVSHDGKQWELCGVKWIQDWERYEEPERFLGFKVLLSTVFSVFRRPKAWESSSFEFAGTLSSFIAGDCIRSIFYGSKGTSHEAWPSERVALGLRSVACLFKSSLHDAS